MSPRCDPERGAIRNMGIQMKTVLCRARLRLFLAFIASIAILPINLSSQEPIDSKLLSGMQWRLIGPFRAGRVTTVAGAADPNNYYSGPPGGGVWKPTDGGQVWHPIFDKERVFEREVVERREEVHDHRAV